MSAKLEYNHVELDSWSPSTTSVIAGDRLNVSRNIGMVKAGVNWRFGWAGSGYEGQGIVCAKGPRASPGAKLLFAAGAGVDLSPRRDDA